MKRILTLVAGLGLAFFLGCKTTDVDSAKLVTTLVVYNGVYYSVQKNPDLKPEFEKVLADLEVVEKGGASVETFLAILNRIPADQRTERLKPVFTSIRILAQTYLDFPGTPGEQEKVKEWAGTIAAGIRLALQDLP